MMCVREKCARNHTEDLKGDLEVDERINLLGILQNLGVRGSLVIKALRYKPAGRGFDPRWCHWNFSVKYSFRSHHGPGGRLSL